MDLIITPFRLHPHILLSSIPITTVDKPISMISHNKPHDQR